MSTPIPRPQRERAASETRDSVLRASILESALELGVGSNRTVAHWIFNTVEEGDESEDVVSPSLTYASTATSDESFTPRSNTIRPQPGAGILRPLPPNKSPSPSAGVVYSPRDGLRTGAASPDTPQRIQFDTRKSPEQHTASPLSWRHNKLRKTRPNGYESDGYTSDGGKALKEKEKKSKKKEKDRVKDKDKDGAATDHESDGGYLSEASIKKKKNKRFKDKGKAADEDSPTADYDPDAFRMTSPSKKEQRSRKGSLRSPLTGDESDGGYVSESSQKKRNFFRLNSRSRKGRDVDSPPMPIPPVPALPTMPLPIAERFLRSPTPNMSDSSRTVTPALSQYSMATERESSDTFVSSASSAATSNERAGSVMSQSSSTLSQEGLTHAFRDAESIRSPSTDLLTTFRHLGISPSKASPLSQSHPYAQAFNEAPIPPDVPVIAPPKTKGSRPTISSPNTSMLSPKHVPVPLVLGSHNSIHSQTGHIVPSPDPDFILVTPTATSSKASPVGSVRPSTEYLVPSPVPPLSPTSPTTLRPHVQAFYDLPPPTPPPNGPLPDLPPFFTRPSADSPEPHFTYRDFPMPPPRLITIAPAPRAARPGAPPVTRSASEPTAPASLPVAPLMAQGASPQRGRVSPFPVAPVLSRKPSVVAFATRTESPVSADPYQSRNNLAVHWQPRSAPPLDRGPGHVRFADVPDDASSVNMTEDDRSVYREDDASYYQDDSEERRDSYYFGDGAEDEGGGDRSSTWSGTGSRQSFMDDEKSAAVRERFVRQVEEMYGPEIIPPVPRLRSALRTGS